MAREYRLFSFDRSDARTRHPQGTRQARPRCATGQQGAGGPVVPQGKARRRDRRSARYRQVLRRILDPSLRRGRRRGPARPRATGRPRAADKASKNDSSTGRLRTQKIDPSARSPSGPWIGSSCAWHMRDSRPSPMTPSAASCTGTNSPSFGRSWTSNTSRTGARTRIPTATGRGKKGVAAHPA